MSVITWIQKRSRLSAMLDRPGGVSVGTALDQAADNLDVLRAESDAIISDRIRDLEVMTAPAPGEPVNAALEQAYMAARAVIDAASPFDRDELCRAASQLCDLIDNGQAKGRFDWRIIEVYTQALRLLFADRSASETVLTHLQQILARKLPQLEA